MAWLALAMVLPFAAGQAQTFLPVPLNLSNTGHAVIPSIAIGPNGEIDVVWLDSGAILFRRSLDGGQTFLPTMTVATTNLPSPGAQTGQPQIAVNSGGVYVAWAGGGDIFFSSLMSGGTIWSSPVNVSNGKGIAGSDSAPMPRIAVDPGGGVDIVWGQNGAYFARTTNGGSSFTTWVLSNSPMAKVSPRMAINSQGHVFVVWEQADPNYPSSNCPTIWFARSTNSGANFTNYSVADDLTVNGQPATGCASDVQIGTGASSTIWLVWANDSPVQDLLVTYAMDQDPFTQGGSTAFPESYSNANHKINLAGPSAYTPRIAMDGNGAMNVVWTGNLQTNDVIYFDRSTNPQDPASFCGGSDSSCNTPPELTGPPPSGALPAGFPQIATEPSGAMDVVWQQASAANPGGAYDIVLARSPDGATFQKFTMDSAPTTVANTGQIAARMRMATCTQCGWGVLGVEETF
jgi:hypothetical protein